jgi:hypothetical protein
LLIENKENASSIGKDKLDLNKLERRFKMRWLKNQMYLWVLMVF